jgi:signal transduction histidine kinase
MTLRYMQSSPSLTPPARRLLAILGFNLIFVALAIQLALQPPWLGLSLQSESDGGISIVKADVPAANIPAGARLLSLRPASTGDAMAIQASDLLEEPDVVNDYVEMDAFFARQTALAAPLNEQQVIIEWQSGDASRIATRIEPRARPWSALPAAFWFQLIVAVSGCLIAGWVWALRPDDWGARMFAISGLSFPVFALPAAVYSTRELAIDGSVFQVLSALNHFGAMMFGAALVGIFLSYPKPLLRPRYLVALFAFYIIWWLIEALRLAPDLNWGHRFGVMSEMLLALLLGIVQWRRSKGEAAHRAALRWFILSILLGSGLFILSIVTTASLGWLPPLPQGYAFGFFLFIYLGIGLGLSRYRLFELDVWAYRLLIWLGGALAVVGLDAMLIWSLNWSGQTALATSLWIVGLVYLPLRNWLWLRFNRSPRVQLHELMPDVVRIAFQPSRSERETLWDSLLQRLYIPLELQTTSKSFATAQLDESGLALAVPACAGVGARYLRHPDHGGRLFSPKDATFMDALIQLMNQGESGREAQERGAIGERRRIARDMHDDVGARLLMLIHHAHTPAMAELARAAMNDLRAALAALDTSPVPMAEALADWRGEATNRCEAANVELSWGTQIEQPERMLSSRQKYLLERVLRESLSNALKHAQPTWVNIHLSQREQALELNLLNDGLLTSAEDWQEGRGLRGMRQRLAEYGGRLEILGRPQGGTHVSIHLPFPPGLQT